MGKDFFSLDWVNEFWDWGCVCFGWKRFQEIIFCKIGCLVGFENRIFQKSFSFDRKKEALTTEIYFRSYFHFKWFPKLRRAKKGAHRRAKGKRERERTISRTRKGKKRERKNDLANTQREKDRAVDRDLAFAPIVISWSVDRDLAKHRVNRDLTKHCVDLAFASAMRSHPSSNPVASLSSFFSQFDRIWWFFFFWVLSMFLYWGMNDIIYLFGNRETVRKCDQIWPDLMIFFLGFVCVSVLRNEWYYIFVSQLRKCEQQVENVFSMVFSRTQRNTRKYFSKHFLKCNQTHENISFPENGIFSGNAFTRTKQDEKFKPNIFLIFKY